MGLSCSCGHDYDQWYEAAEDTESLQTVRSRKCWSCDKRISSGEEVLACYCFRAPRCDYEESRFGDGVPQATQFLCASCAEIFQNLSAAGFCMNLGDSMDECLREFWKMTGFDPTKYQKEGI